MEERNEYLRLIQTLKCKMMSRDYAGARSLILETLETFPKLDHATEMLKVAEILCSAQLDRPGIGMNWYWVLQLYPSAQASIIEDQYKKLISLLDPIKNNFPGTGQALNLIKEAYSVLSDPERRKLFDSKINYIENASGDSNHKVENRDTAEINVGATDLGTPSSSKTKRIIDEVHNGSGDARRLTDNPGCNTMRKKIRAQESLVETSPRISEELLNCSSDEASVTHISNPSTNITDTCGSTPGIQIGQSKWSPKDFIAEQVWALYDDLDAMPRLYVKVASVVSPSEVCVTFLEPHPMIDEEIHWLEEDLPIVCGIFRASGAKTTLEMSRFSHLVNCDRSSRKSFYRIFPQKGEVWAMYKNWNSKWKHSDHIPYQCRLVEILSDYSEENGLIVCSLVEVNGRLTFFQRQLYEGFQLTRQLSRLEMLSFSHRIPAFTMRGVKDRDIPKDSLHVEPDALPPKKFY